MTQNQLQWAQSHDWYAGHIHCVGTDQYTVICAFRIGGRTAIETHEAYRALRVAAGY